MTILDDKRAILNDLQNKRTPISNKVLDKLKERYDMDRGKMVLVLETEQDTFELHENEYVFGELESAFMEFQNGEERILITDREGAKYVYNAKYIIAMTLQEEYNRESTK